MEVISSMVKVVFKITAARLSSEAPLAIAKSGAPPIPNKLVNAMMIVTIGKVKPKPVNAKPET